MKSVHDTILVLEIVEPIMEPIPACAEQTVGI